VFPAGAGTNRNCLFVVVVHEVFTAGAGMTEHAVGERRGGDVFLVGMGMNHTARRLRLVSGRVPRRCGDEPTNALKALR
jgi:hypothetical protein